MISVFCARRKFTIVNAFSGDRQHKSNSCLDTYSGSPVVTRSIFLITVSKSGCRSSLGIYPNISGNELVFTLVLVLNFGQEGFGNDDSSECVVIICFFSSNYDITSRIKYILLRIIRGIQYAPIKFEIADNLSYWSAEIPGKILAKTEALTGPTTPPGKRVQTINPLGSEVEPGGIATWGRSLVDEAEAMGFKWKRKGRSSKHIPFDWNGP
ncbi:MAG TPA: DUF1326 domain-containing protein [Nitrososphaeraceae archaeon]